MAKPLFFVLISCITFSASAFASETCTEVRLDKTILKNTPPYDQKNMGVCYAIAAAQAVDAWRSTHSGGKKIAPASPLHAAIKHTDGYKKPLIDEFANQVELEGEKIQRSERASEYIQQAGSPTPENLVSTYNHLKSEYQFKKEALTRIKQFGYDYGDTEKTLEELVLNGTCSQKAVDRIQGRKKKRQLENAVKAYSSINQSIKKHKIDQYDYCPDDQKDLKNNIRDILSAALEDSKIHIDELRQDIAQACAKKEEKIVPRPKVKSISFAETDSDERTQVVHQLLNITRAQPIVVDLCSDILENEEFRDQIHQVGMQTACEKSTDHTMLIVGRRLSKGGKCQFLVRNSWGEKCPAQYLWECEKGQLWIDEDKLVNSTGKISYLE